MMPDWKLLAQARGLPAGAIERILPSLETLEASFRPLARAIPPEIEPAIIFHAGEDQE